MNGLQSTTLDNILTAAKKEFLSKGYQGASLRVIAKKAGVTTGAFYGYFKNKEELFDALAGEQYRHILKLYTDILENFQSLPPEEQMEHMQDYTAAGVREMTDYMYENYAAFKLILCCSEGTKYCNLVHEMAALDVDATHEFTKTSSDAGNHVNEVNHNLEHILTSGMFSMFFELIIHDIPRAEAGEYISQLLEFYYAGWAKIMGL